jgi:hypothetical protein
VIYAFGNLPLDIGHATQAIQREANDADLVVLYDVGYAHAVKAMEVEISAQSNLNVSFCHIEPVADCPQAPYRRDLPKKEMLQDKRIFMISTRLQFISSISMMYSQNKVICYFFWSHWILFLQSNFSELGC